MFFFHPTRDLSWGYIYIVQSTGIKVDAIFINLKILCSYTYSKKPVEKLNLSITICYLKKPTIYFSYFFRTCLLQILDVNFLCLFYVIFKRWCKKEGGRSWIYISMAVQNVPSRRRGRNYREKNPPRRLSIVGPRSCVQCTLYSTFIRHLVFL